MLHSFLLSHYTESFIVKEVIQLVYSEKDTKKCVHCSKDIRLTSKFCSFCGKNAVEEDPFSNAFNMDNSGGREENFDDIFSAIGDAFNIDIPEDRIAEEDEEELLDEEDFDEILSDWEDEELEDYETLELRELMEIGKGVCRGIIPDEELEELLGYLREKLHGDLSYFDEIKEAHKNASFVIRELLVRIDRAFKLYSEALDEIDKYFTDRDSDHILEGMDLAVSAVSRLYTSFLLLQEEAFEDEDEDDFFEEEIKKMDTAWKSKISEIIPEDDNYYDTLDEEEEYYTNPNFERLKSEVELLKEGKINEERFSSTLKWMSSNLESGRKDFEDISSPSSEEDKYLDTVITNALDAFRIYEHGLREMEKFFSDKDFVHLDNGLDMAFEATQIIAQLQISFEDPEEIIFIN